MISTVVSITDPKICRYKQLVWEKNYNGKLCCDGFVHVDLAPTQMPTPQLLDETIFIITLKEDRLTKHYFQLVNVQSVIAERLPETAIIASHGIRATAYFDMMFKKYHQAFSWKTEMGIYFYLSFKP